ncbi:MAG TPA: signal peptidase I [Elusimicrobiota bacterium]|nr:signal peptidase I [Elusimicrobiota bacterium]
MEEKLFWISIACGAYAFLLRWFVKKEARLQDWRLTAAMHGIFWMLTGVVAGSLFVSYAERAELTWPLMAGLGAAGAVLGVLLRALRNRSSAEISWKLIREDLEWADTGFSAILLASFIMYFFVQAFKIPSGSMRNTLMEGDHLFVNKFVYGVRIPYTTKKMARFRQVRRGDVVVFRFPTNDKRSPHYGKDFIKRAVALPGDTVEIRRKKLFVNGEPVVEPYTNFAEDYVIPPSRLFPEPGEFQKQWEIGAMAQLAGETVRDNFGPVTVPSGHYFVMGDNRDRSFDARFWGPLSDKYLKGRAWVVYLPIRRAKVIR